MKLPGSQELRSALDLYAEVIGSQGVERMPELDHWYHNQLPGLISARAAPHITLPELARLTEWKMTRGKWRGRNLTLVRGNDEAAVREISAAALAEMPHPTKPVSKLAKLAGVGPATASAVAAAASPEQYPFFDELVAAQLPGLGEVKWTLGYYARYADILRTAASEMGSDWTPAMLERALWAHAAGKTEADRK